LGQIAITGVIIDTFSQKNIYDLQDVLLAIYVSSATDIFLKMDTLKVIVLTRTCHYWIDVNDICFLQGDGSYSLF